MRLSGRRGVGSLLPGPPSGALSAMPNLMGEKTKRPTDGHKHRSSSRPRSKLATGGESKRMGTCL